MEIKNPIELSRALGKEAEALREQEKHKTTNPEEIYSTRIIDEMIGKIENDMNNLEGKTDKESRMERKKMVEKRRRFLERRAEIIKNRRDIEAA